MGELHVDIVPMPWDCEDTAARYERGTSVQHPHALPSSHRAAAPRKGATRLSERGAGGGQAARNG
jgi:hypothetical protein